MTTDPRAAAPPDLVPPPSSPLDGIDVALAERLLGEALGSGGEYADLYFEYRSGADFVFEEGRVRTVGRGIVLGLGVRVLRGDSTGYAYTEELSEERMRDAARTAGQIATGGGSPGPVPIRHVSLPDFYPVKAPSLERPGRDKVDLLRRADQAARGYDKRIVRVEASMSEEWRDVLVVTSDGRYARDRQPMIRFGVNAVAEEGGKRQGGRAGGAARRGHGALPPARAEPRGAGARGRPAGHRHAPRRRGARRTDAGRAGARRIRDPAARGGRSRPGGRLQPQAHLQLHRSGREGGRLGAVHGGRRRHHRPRPRLDQRGRRGQPRAAQRPHRERDPGRLHAGSDLVPPLPHRGHRQRPARELPARAAASHDQHPHARQATSRPRTSSAR